MSTTVKNSKMARRYGEDFKRQAVELMIHSGKTQRQAREEGSLKNGWQKTKSFTSNRADQNPARNQTLPCLCGGI